MINVSMMIHGKHEHDNLITIIYHNPVFNINAIIYDKYNYFEAIENHK